jgi:hypothetical protein
MKTEITVDADLELVRDMVSSDAFVQVRQAIMDKRCDKVVIQIKRLGEGVWEATFQGAGEDGEADLVVWLTRLPEKVLSLFAEPVPVSYRDELKMMAEDVKFKAEAQPGMMEAMASATVLPFPVIMPPVPANNPEEVKSTVEEAKCQAEADARLMEAMATGAFPPHPIIPPPVRASYREEVRKILAEQKRDPAAWQVLPTDIEMRPIAPTEMSQRVDTIAQQLLGMCDDQRTSELRKLRQSDPRLYPYVVARLDALKHARLQNVPGADPKDEAIQSVRVDESANYLLPGERAFLVPKAVVDQFMKCPCDLCHRFLSCLADVAAVAIKEDYCRVSIRFIGVRSSSWIGPVSTFGEAVFELRDMPPAIKALWDKPVTVPVGSDGYRRLGEGEVVPLAGAFVHTAWLSAILVAGQPALALGRPFRPIVRDGSGQWYYLSDDGSRHPFSLPAALKARAIFVKA